MAVTVVRGNIFNSRCTTLVNTVNCSGFMGRGIALEFRLRYPEMFEKYARICTSGQLKPGLLWVYQAADRTVLNFPTKDDWRAPSEMRFIQSGLEKFSEKYQEKGITSIAFPLLGTSNGGLNEEDVLKLMIQSLSGLNIDVEIYHYQPDASDDLYQRFEGMILDHSATEIATLTGVRSHIISTIQSAVKLQPYHQINQLMSIKGVGEQTLIKLFDFMRQQQSIGQLTLHD
ncbi:macro domain-containing protein [Erwinia sorbitola]|uniref:Appr-1-p processing protein n=1 Tax=Erwinia sorbitola TaxID=2681984 RepID=A0A6I6EJL0_9GAMM|nr:macro domain-containing protein [Erwinia sorbitola]MTD27206.1 Appr-1-p processing protein [Erwinia sorbitola]QGU88758.1 Appr-1-p processing protein [Erwinia sorbitola]